jgi:hypothetical protein
MFSQFWKIKGYTGGVFCITQWAFLAQLIVPQNHDLVKENFP